MYTETLNDRTTPHRVRRSVTYPTAFNLDIPALVVKLKKTQAWLKGELYYSILLKTSVKQILLTALPENTEVESFQQNESVTVHIIEGRLRFNTPEAVAILYKGNSLTLRDKIKYRLTSLQDTIFLLTISTRARKAGDN